MNLKERIENVENLKEAIICISFGTFVGILTYYIFLYFHIDIYGWNFGLIFAPLAAGYAETILAKRIIGEDIGAISAFILFLVTVVYGFIIANPTLGVNVITFGSIIVILQAALAALINYFFLAVIIGTFILGVMVIFGLVGLFLLKGVSISLILIAILSVCYLLLSIGWYILSFRN